MAQRLQTPIESLEPRALLSGILAAQTVTVRVFLDRNSDLRRNHTESGLAGIHVTAKRLVNSLGALYTASGNTDSRGVAYFTTYIDSLSSDVPTASISLGQVDQYRCDNHKISSNGSVAGTAAPSIEFGMVDYALVTGHIGYYYRTKDDPSAGLPSRVVFDDANKNGKRDHGEPAAETDLDGDYSLTLHGGTHTLRLAVSSIWSAAKGSKLAQSYTLLPGRYAAPVEMTPVMTAPVTITVLAGYTTAANQNLLDAGELAAPAYITNMLYQANKVYANSDTNVRLKLVGTPETSYRETGSIDDDLSHLYDDNDGKLDDLLVARDKLKADLVTLITAPDLGLIGPHDDDDTIGLGYQFARGYQNDRLGLTVVRLEDTDEDGFTLAHELGHNLGAGHDPANVDDDILTAPYAHGYIFRGADGKNYRDIMAYGDAHELPFFSTPLFKFAGKPIGNAATADNARVVRDIAPEVAAYR